MNTKRAWLIILSLVCAMALVGSAVSAIRGLAAPLPIPTPVSNPGDRVSSAVAARYPITFMNAKVIAADGRGTTYSLPEYNILDLQYVIDQGTTPNTVTLKLQFSNDGINWANGGNLVASSVTDGATDMIQLNNFGRYTNIYADVANTQTITVSVIAVAK